MKKTLLLLAVILANNALYADYTVIIGVRDVKFKEATITEPETPVTPEEPEPEPEPTYSSCRDILVKDAASGNGVYTVKSGGSDLSVYCDMSGGGWTLVGVGIRNQVGNWATTEDNNIGITPSPSPAASFKLADSRINGISKSLYRTTTTGRYAANRYFSGNCHYSQTATSSGACNVSYSDEALTQGSKVGTPTDTVCGLSDFSSSTGLYVATSYTGFNIQHGWGMGNGVNPAYSGTGSAGEGANVQIWVK